MEAVRLLTEYEGGLWLDLACDDGFIDTNEDYQQVAPAIFQAIGS